MPTVLVPQERDFPRWYQDVIAKAQLAENGPVRGTMVIRPWGYAIWERLQTAIDERIKASARGCRKPSRDRTEKETVALQALAEVPRMLVDDQMELLAQATRLRDGRTRPARSVDEALEIASEGFARLRWQACGADGEERLAQDGVSVRCLVRDDGEPVDDPNAAGVDALVARAY